MKMLILGIIGILLVGGVLILNSINEYNAYFEGNNFLCYKDKEKCTTMFGHEVPCLDVEIYDCNYEECKRIGACK